MLHVPIGSQSFGYNLASYGTTRPAAAMGTSITPAAGSYGSYAALGSALAADAYGILVCINSAFTSASARASCVCIGADPAGGSSYADIITDLLGGGADSYSSQGRAGGGMWYFFPLFIPAGTTLAARAWSNLTTVMRVAVTTFHRPVNPSMFRKGSFVETVGSHTQPNGVTLAPGTTSEGSWVSLGATVRRLWWWQIGIQVSTSDTSWGAVVLHVDLAVGDASNKDLIIQDLQFVTSASEAEMNQSVAFGAEWDVPAGSSIYMRAQNSGTNDVYNVLAYGMGG